MTFVREDLFDLVDLERKNSPGLQEIICIGEGTPPSPSLSYTELMDLAEAQPAREDTAHADDLLVLQYTPETTGFPKRAMYTHGTLLWNSFHQVRRFRSHCGRTFKERKR